VTLLPWARTRIHTQLRGLNTDAHACRKTALQRSGVAGRGCPNAVRDDSTVGAHAVRRQDMRPN
jgi:hypothetical protein